jgi:hypothetical protein
MGIRYEGLNAAALPTRKRYRPDDHTSQQSAALYAYPIRDQTGQAEPCTLARAPARAKGEDNFKRGGGENPDGDQQNQGQGCDARPPMAPSPAATSRTASSNRPTTGRHARTERRAASMSAARNAYTANRMTNAPTVTLARRRR